MKLYGLNRGEFTGSAVFKVGSLKVSISNVFHPASTTCIFEPGSARPVKEFKGNDADTVVKALRWAKRREKQS